MENIASFLCHYCLNYMTFVENIFYFYHSGPYSPTVHIAPNSPITFLTGGVALWELTDNFHTFIQQHSCAEHDDLVSSVCVCVGSTRAVSGSHDRRYTYCKQKKV